MAELPSPEQVLDLVFPLDQSYSDRELVRFTYEPGFVNQGLGIVRCIERAISSKQPNPENPNRFIDPDTKKIVERKVTEGETKYFVNGEVVTLYT